MVFLIIVAAVGMVKVTSEFLKFAHKKQLNIVDIAASIKVEDLCDLSLTEQDDFFETAVGLVYQATRRYIDTFWFWAVRNKELVGFVGIEGSPWGVFVLHFEGSAQW